MVDDMKLRALSHREAADTFWSKDRLFFPSVWASSCENRAVCMLLSCLMKRRNTLPLVYEQSYRAKLPAKLDARSLQDISGDYTSDLGADCDLARPETRYCNQPNKAAASFLPSAHDKYVNFAAFFSPTPSLRLWSETSMVKVGPSPLSTSLQAVVKRSASSLIEVNLDPNVGSGSSACFHALVLAAKVRATNNAKDFMVVRGEREWY